MQNFKDRVRNKMERDGRECTQQQEGIISLLCSRGNYTIGIYTKKHGRVYDALWNKLRVWGMKYNRHVLFAHENSERGVSFVRVYPGIIKIKGA